MPQSTSIVTRIGLVVAIVSAVGVPWPGVVAAHGRRDPLEQMERQRRRTDDRKIKRREEHDVQGAEIRDAKKSAQDSRQSQTQSEVGAPNQQTSPWIGF